MNEPDDTRWARACLDGDLNAFSRLVDRHRDAVYNLAYRMTGNPTTAEDVAQETFVRAFTRLQQYKPRFSFRNWVLGICANLARGRYRKGKRSQALEQTFAQHETLRRELRETTDGEMALHEAVDQALMRLPHSLRAPVILKYMEGMSLQDIAETLGLRISAAKMRLARGRERLRKELEPVFYLRGETP